MKRTRGVPSEVSGEKTGDPEGVGFLPRGDARDHRRVMEQIHGPFDASRARPWPQVVRWLERHRGQGVLLDLAAGNGRHSMAAAGVGHDVVAVDVAGGLLSSLRERWVRKVAGEGGTIGCVEADALRLPFKDAAFTKAIFVAGLHCIRGRGARLQALAELRRVLEPGAPVLVTVWWRDPKRFRGPLTRTKEAIEAPRSLPAQPPPGAECDPDGTWPALEPGDVVLNWSHDVKRPVGRFFHLYEGEELEKDLEEVGFKGVRIENVRQGSTWNLIAQMVR